MAAGSRSGAFWMAMARGMAALRLTAMMSTPSSASAEPTAIRSVEIVAGDAMPSAMVKSGDISVSGATRFAS